MIVGERRNVYVNLRVCVTIPRMNWEPLFIDTELCPLLTAPIQIKHLFRLVTINVQQLRTFTDSLLLGQETLQVKT